MNREREQVFDEFMELIYKISRDIHAYDSVPRNYGTDDLLYMVEAHTIKLIGKSERIGVTDIANITGKTKGAVSQIIDKLTEKKIVNKEKEPEDNRRIKLSLTEKGQKIFEFHKELDKKNYQMYLDSIKNVRTQEISTCLKVLRNMDKYGKNS
ncbi:MarR family winged helix-turn-helix transcriptional regulator [Abyssisolibacter fermentans]|uniref:MarR family winged helix-turn-helix transcriptional regulator n=1 Tax=Abyssisolibacter fermentans TaxID=1766203 RepID=UPI001FA7EBAC|nr:MarR family transcriptional regulator [Abyssisolibacter fermentans]